MDTKRLTIKQNMIWNSIGNFIYLGLQWVITVIVLRNMGLEAAGVYSLALSVTAVFACIATWGLSHFQVSDIEEKYKNSDYIAVRMITCIAALAICGVFVCFNAYSRYQQTVIMAYMFYRITEAAADVLACMMQKRERMDFVGQSYMLRGLLGFGAFCISLLAWHNVCASVVCMCISSGLIIIIFDLRNAKSVTFVSLDSQYVRMKTLLLEGLPLAVNAALVTAIVAVPRYFLEQIYGLEAVGIYGSIAAPTLIVQVAANYLLTPFITPLAKYWHDENKQAFLKMSAQSIGMLALLSIAALLGSIVLGEEILVLLLGEEIREHTYLLLPIIGCAAMAVFIWFENALLVILRAGKGMLLSNLTGAVVCTAVSAAMLQKFYINGTSYALFSGYLTQAIISAIVMQRHLRN